MLQRVCIIVSHEVPGLDDIGAFEQCYIDGNVTFGTAEVVFAGVEIYVKAVAVIEACDSELEDLNFLEEVRHEFGCLIC